MKRTVLVSCVWVAAMIGGVSLGWAHSTGHESRTVADCEKLPGTEAAGERGMCLKCVQRPKPHHFHPDMMKGDRCHPDDGRPR